MTANTMTPIDSKEHYFQLLSSEDTLVVYFSALDCSVCHAVQPKLEALLAEFPVKIIKIEASKFVDLAGQHLVFAMPTILIFHEGREILRESRFIDFKNIERLMDVLFN